MFFTVSVLRQTLAVSGKCYILRRFGGQKRPFLALKRRVNVAGELWCATGGREVHPAEKARNAGGVYILVLKSIYIGSISYALSSLGSNFTFYSNKQMLHRSPKTARFAACCKKYFSLSGEYMIS